MSKANEHYFAATRSGKTFATINKILRDLGSTVTVEEILELESDESE